MSKKDDVNFDISKKDEFIKVLISMNPLEINEYIKEHGKGPKRINAFTLYIPGGKNDGKQ